MPPYINFLKKLVTRIELVTFTLPIPPIVSRINFLLSFQLIVVDTTGMGHLAVYTLSQINPLFY
jgi:hypothetical protein